MTLHFTSGDILNVPANIACHQVNCMGVMGAGLAAQIKRKFPNVYIDYKNMCAAYSTHEQKALLGKAQLVKINSDKIGYIANLFGQYNYGTKNVQTNPVALESAIKQLCLKINNEKRPITISVPYGMGCGLAGGDWNEIMPLIVNTIANMEREYGMNITLKIVRYNPHEEQKRSM